MLLALALGVCMTRAQTVATLTIQPDASTFTIPVDYLGFSYESMQLTDPDFFSPSNTGLIKLFRRLCPRGVLRLGGNSSELKWWKGRDDEQTPQQILDAAARTGSGTNRTPYAITQAAIDNLSGFLRATGWKLIYNLNLGADPVENDAEEAKYVAAKVGSNLISFQIGNEPDLYVNRSNGARQPGWTFDDYVKEWTGIAAAVSKEVPNAKFSGPDVGHNVKWVVQFGEAVQPTLGDRLIMLTEHYYAMGPAGGKNITMERLLSPKPQIGQALDEEVAEAQKLGIRYRMTEGNSCYRGGQAGVSNAFGSALWGADYLLELAAHGNSGVNLHGGGGKQIGASLGNQIPGARNDQDLEIAKLGSFYTPIAGNREAGFTARPIFYGMMFTGPLLACRMVRSTFDPAGANATAYVARNGQDCIIALINKDPSADLTVAISGVPNVPSKVLRLTGPSLDATEGTMFAGSQIGPMASWTSKVIETGDPTRISLPHASAALVFVPMAHVQRRR